MTLRRGANVAGDLPLLVHGEVTTGGVDLFDRVEALGDGQAKQSSLEWTEGALALLIVLLLLEVSTKIRSKMRSASSRRKITATISGYLMSGSVTLCSRRSSPVGFPVTALSAV